MRLTEQCVLITGGAGFIGSNLADSLLAKGSRVICYDNLSPYYQGKEANVEANLRNPLYRFIKSDILDRASLSESAKPADVIIHLAAQPGVRHSMENAEAVIRVNVEGTASVLEAGRKVDVTKIVFASSSSVYGNPNKLPVAEHGSTNPVSPYGVSKLAAEEVCRTYSELYGMRITVLRYFTVYGPRQRPDMAVRLFLQELENNRPITIFGDGKQTRDLTYVGDIVDGTLSAAEAELSRYEVFNLGSGHRLSLLSLVGTLSEVTGKEFLESCRFEPAKAGDVTDTHANIEKARRLIGFNPQTRLKDGLRSFVNWYRAFQTGS